jgi:uncharacterized damage-inducible protein DinB
MIVDLFKLLAKYNMEVNSKMNVIIKSLSEDEWNHEFSGYYKSIHELCSHIYVGDYRWWNKFITLIEYKNFNKDFFVKNHNYNEILFANISEYLKERQELDKIIMDYANELTKNDLNKTLKFTNADGINVEKELKIYLTDLSHHQTHHRGMISLYLEFLGKENDYSALYPYG